MQRRTSFWTPVIESGQGDHGHGDALASDTSMLPRSDGPADATTNDAQPDGSAGCAPSPTNYGKLRTTWVVQLETGSLDGIAIDPLNNNILLGGTAAPSAPPGTRQPLPIVLTPFVDALDTTGHALWHRSFVGSGELWAIGVDAQGNIYITGTILDTKLDLGTGALLGTLFLAKLDSTGKTVWAQGFDANGQGLSAGLALGVDSAGDVALMGTWPEPIDFGAGIPASAVPYGGFVTAFDTSGTCRFTKAFNGQAGGASVQFDSLGNLAIAGSFTGIFDLGTPFGSVDSSGSFVVKLDMAGNVVWRALDISDARPDAVAAGAAATFSAGGDNSGLFMAAQDNAGKSVFRNEIPGWGGVRALAADSTGGVVAVGEIVGFTDFGGGLLRPGGAFLSGLDSTGHHIFSARFEANETTGGSVSAQSVAVDKVGAIAMAGTFSGDIDFGQGVLSANPSTSTSNQSIFVAKFEEAAGAPVTFRQCPPPTNAGLPPSGHFVDYSVGLAPDNLALTATTLYWSTYNSLLSAPIAGGVPSVIALGKGVFGLVTDAQRLYWGSNGTGSGIDGTIMTAALAGGVPTVLTPTGTVPSALAVDDVSVYWVAGGVPPYGIAATLPDGVLMSLPLQGGTPKSLVTGLTLPGPIAARGGKVAFASGVLNSTNFRIQTVSSTGGTVTVLATTDRSVKGIAFDSANVYWVDANSRSVDTSTNDGRVRSVPLTGGTPLTLASNQHGPGKLVLLDGNLYWSTFGSWTLVSSPNDGGIWSVTTAGGTPVAVVGNETAVGSFAIDGTRVFWADDLNPYSAFWSLFVSGR